MKRKRRKLAAIICAFTLALSSAVPVSACTPPLKPPSVKIPDINFEPDGALEDATSYKVRITKADGTWKEYDTTYTSFYSTNYTDDFIADGMDDATVMVRAYGENGTFSLWSKTTTITRFRY